MSALDDLRALGYELDVGDGVVAVRGFGVATMVMLDDARSLAALADRAAHAERRLQFLEQPAWQARGALERAGYAVARIDDAVDVFSITPPLGSTDLAVAAATPRQLVAYAAAAKVKPNAGPVP